MLFLPVLPVQAPLQIYVSPSGKDANSGSSWGSSLATLQKAVDVAGGSATTIHCRGTLRITKPVVVNNASGLKIVGEGHARLTGSSLIKGWVRDTFNGTAVWSAGVRFPDIAYELFTGPKLVRATRARFPKTGFLHFAEIPSDTRQRSALYFPKDIPELRHPEEVEAVVHQLWVTSRMTIDNMFPDKHFLSFRQGSLYPLADSKSSQPSNYYLENVAEAVKNPGDWYYDTGMNTVYYVPRPGDTLAGFTAETPMVDSVLQIVHGSNVEVQNIEFSGSEFRYPAGVAGDNQAAISVPGAVKLIDCDHCLLSHDTVTAAGTYGFEVLKSGQGNRIERCTVTDVGGGGVKVGHDTSGTTVADCTLTHLSKVEASAVGVWIGNSGHNVISHNRIEDVGYTGISVGWTWGYGKSNAVDNLIESNLIRDIGHGELSDMGGIYTLGISPGSVLRHNRIDHVRCTYYGGWGIYFDEGTSNMVAEDNLVTDCQTGNFHQHYGANNEVRNNIFGFASTIGQAIRTRVEGHTSFTMERNLFEWQGTPLFGGNLAASPAGVEGIVFKDNLLWEIGATPDLPSFAQTQGNVIGDPLFADARKGDFRLSARSPAFKLGFRVFPLSGRGPR